MVVIIPELIFQIPQNRGNTLYNSYKLSKNLIVMQLHELEKMTYCSDFRNESNGILCSGGFFSSDKFRLYK